MAGRRESCAGLSTARHQGTKACLGNRYLISQTLETNYDLVTLCASVIQLKESKPAHVQEKAQGT